jgi:catechol 2,3-dioxygenase-like lactoylglutathione lyase family enzyme
VFDHLGIVVRDLHTASAFYDAVLPPIGIVLMENNARPDGTGWLVFSTGAPESPFFVVAADRPTFWVNEHEASRSRAGLVAGATNNGDPGVRRGRYYCAFLIDPDGNNIEAGVYADI